MIRKGLVVAMSVVSGLGGCASLDQGNGELGAHTGLYWITGATYNDIRDQAQARCPGGYQFIDMEHPDAFEWQGNVRCKGTPAVDRPKRRQTSGQPSDGRVAP